MLPPKNYTDETYRVLRNVRILDQGELEGKRFVRCIPVGKPPYPKLSGEQQTAMAYRVSKEINESGVVVAHNPTFGGEYVRVETRTATFRLICQMKS